MPTKKKKPEPAPKPLPLSAAVPVLREEALRLAGGDASRVEVLSPTEARVR